MTSDNTAPSADDLAADKLAVRLVSAVINDDQDEYGRVFDAIIGSGQIVALAVLHNVTFLAADLAVEAAGDDLQAAATDVEQRFES